MPVMLDCRSRSVAQARRYNIVLPWSSRRRSVKRRKLPTARLGKKQRGSFFLRLFRRMRLRWLRLQYLCLLKKLKSFYSSLIRDLIEAGPTVEVIQSRIMLETYFSVPVIPGTVASIPSHIM